MKNFYFDSSHEDMNNYKFIKINNFQDSYFSLWFIRLI